MLNSCPAFNVSWIILIYRFDYMLLGRVLKAATLPRSTPHIIFVRVRHPPVSIVLFVRGLRFFVLFDIYGHLVSIALLCS